MKKSVSKMSSDITFKSDNCRASFFPNTLEKLDKVYKDYKASLHEVSFSEVKSSALSLSQELQVPKKEVLKAMQLVTQFANVKSLKPISERMDKEGLEVLGDLAFTLQFLGHDIGFNQKNKVLLSLETGVHRALNYVFNRKQLAPISLKKNGCIGIILDNEKIAHFEQIKKTEPELFDKLVKHKKVKFFYISGWDNGISVFDRTKSLKDITRDLILSSKEQGKSLEDALDGDNLEKIKSLGIKPIVIKNEKEGTELNVYNQMRPEQINKSHLINIVEANTLFRASQLENVSEQSMAKMNDKAVDYLSSTLCVYTPEKMSKDLKKMHEMITEYAEKQNKEVIYIRPSTAIKSNDYIAYSYKKINNIDSSRFMFASSLSNKSNHLVNKIDPKNTLLVVLDDCALSGNSIRSIRDIGLRDMGLSKEFPILFANLKVTDIAYKDFKSSKSSYKADMLYLEKINTQNLSKNKGLKSIIGKPMFGDEALSVVFPYMSPDNCSELASNIAFLHNSKYRTLNFSKDFNRKYLNLFQISKFESPKQDELKREYDRTYSYFYSGIKNTSQNVRQVSANYACLIGATPNIVEKELGSAEKITLLDRLKSLFHHDKK